jgi:hypothetical protein
MVPGVTAINEDLLHDGVFNGLTGTQTTGKEMDEKKHTMTGESWQLKGAKFSLKNGSPAADRLRREKIGLPQKTVKPSAKKRSVFVPALLCSSRVERGAAAEFTRLDCSIGGLRKTACAGVVFDGGKKQFPSHLHKFALHSFHRGAARCKESVAGFGCGGLLPILLDSVALL